MAALREIKNLQKSINPAIPKAPLLRLVRELIYERNDSLRLHSVAFEAIREASESFLTGYFSGTFVPLCLNQY